MAILAGICVVLISTGSAARADVMDDFQRMRGAWETVTLDLYGGRLSAEGWSGAVSATEEFGRNLQSPAARALWETSELSTEPSGVQTAALAGRWKAKAQHVLALEMAHRQAAGELLEARKWRALIDLPKYADAVQGALALQSDRPTQREEISRLLLREYLIWQSTLVREKLSYLDRLLAKDRVAPDLLAARTAEIDELSNFPAALLPEGAGAVRETLDTAALASLAGEPDQLRARFGSWKDDVLAGLPELLDAEDVDRRERLMVKLLRLVPMEYKAGVRDGQVVIPIEYREAETFAIQARQIFSELQTPWRRNRPDLLSKYGEQLAATLTDLEAAIAQKSAASEVESLSEQARTLLEKQFGIDLRRRGTAAEVVAETLLDVRSLLTQSLMAAQAGEWSRAENLRIDAYTNFDLEIETRVLPRNPDLAIKSERMFLDGGQGQIGIKAALDARLSDQALEASYQAALDGLQECAALLQTGLSPATTIFTTITIVTREGLEAVVILAALLAGMRGPENRKTRRCIGAGAWVAVVAAIGTFLLSRFVITSLSQYGERLEAVVSTLAVLILLIVTNWIFHKAYWVQWNSRLRSLSKAVDAGGGGRWTTLAMVGVGFLTIYREGFETVLFLQSLILEGGFKTVAIGLVAGGGVIATAGFAIFAIGARLPYRKLLVYTGVLVATILVTFLGSTVRLFQTVGWMPIHPITDLDIPTWMGTWLGLYPSWEGLLVPPLGLVYVGGAWLFVKWRSASRAVPVVTPVTRQPREPDLAAF